MIDRRKSIVLFGFIFSIHLVSNALSIETTAISRDTDYARISTNRAYSTFFIDNLSAPTPREECRLGTRVVKWNIEPRTMGGCSEDTSEMFIVYFSNPGDFGKSYHISVKVVWPEFDQKTGDKRNEIIQTASYNLDAIVYTVDVACSDGTRCYNNVSKLVDNHPARAVVSPLGCTRKDLLKMNLKTKPKEKLPLNKRGTNMNFFRSENPCEFNADKTYWYGLAHPNDCYYMQYYYNLELWSDTEPVASIDVCVGWPDEHPEMVMTTTLQESEPYVEKMHDGTFIMKMKPWRFVFNVEKYGASDQYGVEVDREEEYHRQQALGVVGLEFGGEPDLYDMDRVFAGVPMSDGYYIFHSTPFETKDTFCARVRYQLAIKAYAECDISKNYWVRDTGYREKMAKQVAGYNAAWRYHCTYGNADHPESQYWGEEEDLKAREARK